MRRIGFYCGVFTVLLTGVAGAQTRGFQASLTPDIAIHDRETRIEGLTLSIWGENPQSAVSIGFVNGSVGPSRGFSIGLVNYAEQYNGAQWSLVNINSGNFTGWQGGFALGLAGSVLNYCGGDLNGVQTGLVNLTGGMSGVQIGLVNYAQRMDQGFQLGLVNMIGNSSGWFANWPNEIAPGMILVNWKF